MIIERVKFWKNVEDFWKYSVQCCKYWNKTNNKDFEDGNKTILLLPCIRPLLSQNERDSEGTLTGKSRNQLHHSIHLISSFFNWNNRLWDNHQQQPFSLYLFFSFLFFPFLFLTSFQTYSLLIVVSKQKNLEIDNNLLQSIFSPWSQ